MLFKNILPILEQVDFKSPFMYVPLLFESSVITFLIAIISRVTDSGLGSKIMRKKINMIRKMYFETILDYS